MRAQVARCFSTGDADAVHPLHDHILSSVARRQDQRFAGLRSWLANPDAVASLRRVDSRDLVVYFQLYCTAKNPLGDAVWTELVRRFHACVAAGLPAADRAAFLFGACQVFHLVVGSLREATDPHLFDEGEDLGPDALWAGCAPLRRPVEAVVAAVGEVAPEHLPMFEALRGLFGFAEALFAAWDRDVITRLHPALSAISVSLRRPRSTAGLIPPAWG